MSQERREITEKLQKDIDELFKKYLLEMSIFREEQVDFLIMAEKMKAIATPKEKIVKFDIGGQIFSTTIDVLTSEKDTFFTGMFSEFSKQFLNKPSEEGIYFIDRDPTYFRFILNYLRYGKTKPIALEAFDSFQLDDLKFEVEFYQIQSLLDLINKYIYDHSVRSKLISSQEVKCLDGWIGKAGKWKLIYTASVDGWKTQQFHNCCDRKGPTVTIIKTQKTGFIFGGYSAGSWSSDSVYEWNNGKNFLFSFLNANGKQSIKLDNSGPNGSGQYGIYSDPHYGPTFGGGHDLYICNNSNQVCSSYTNLGHSYEAPTEYFALTDGIKSYLAGSYQFMVAEIEVFEIQ